MAVYAPNMGAQMRAIPLPPVLAFLMGVPAAPREAVERTIQAAIDALDAMDGDPDTEADGDELDGNDAEDDFWLRCQGGWASPGCPISDPGGQPELLPLFPDYAVDQSKGPTNEHEADRLRGLLIAADGAAYWTKRDRMRLA